MVPFLKAFRFLSPFLVVCPVLTLGCASQKLDPTHELTEDEALALAVDLANDECFRKFTQSPFDPATYAVEFRNGRWEWGDLDQFGIHGYSARVSFDVCGGDRRVEIYLSTDRLH